MDPSFAYLVIGSVGATGAALAVGTLAALVRIRSGADQPDAGSTRTELSRTHIVGLWIRVALGVTVAVWAAATIFRSGIL